MSVNNPAWKVASPTYVLDLNLISSKAYSRLMEMDEKFVGTPDYMGLAYFWNMAYKFSLRDASPAQRQAVHKEFLKAGLPLVGESPQHMAILEKLRLHV